MPFWPTATSSSVSTFALNEATDALEFVFASETAAAITRLGFNVSSRTGAQPTYRVSLQGVGATGNPDGAVKGGGSPASATFTPAANGWLWVTLSNSYTPALGELLALVIDYSSGAIGGSNFCTFGSRILNLDGAINRFPYHVENNAGSRSRSNATSVPVYGYGGASTAFGHPANTGVTTGALSGVAGEALALKFTLPSSWGDTFKVAGLKMFCSVNANDAVFRLYDGTSVLQSFTLDVDALASSSLGRVQVMFTSLSTLSFGSTYRVGIADDTGSGSPQVPYFPLAAAGDADAYPLGQSACLSYFDGSSTWTDYADRRPFVELILADVTEPAGGGGGGVSGARIFGGF